MADGRSEQISRERGAPRIDARATMEPLSNAERSPTTVYADDLSPTRDDFALLAAAHKRAQLPVVFGVVPVPMAALVAYGALNVVPGLSLGLALTVGAFVGAGIFACLWLWEGKRLRDKTAVCPSCGDVLLPAHALTRGHSRVELIVATGSCPACGQTLFAPTR